jgi:hypothetical protein
MRRVEDVTDLVGAGSGDSCPQASLESALLPFVAGMAR